MTKTIDFISECTLSEINVGDFLVYPSTTYPEFSNNSDVLKIIENITTYDGRTLVKVIKKSEVIEIIESKSGKTLTIIIENKSYENGKSTFYKGLKTTYIFKNFDK